MIIDFLQNTTNHFLTFLKTKHLDDLDMSKSILN